MKNLLQSDVISFLGDSANTDASVDNLVTSIISSFTGELGDWCPGLQNALLVKYAIDESHPGVLLPPSPELPVIDLNLITDDTQAAQALAKEIVRYTTDPNANAPIASAMANYFMLSDMGTYIQGVTNTDELHQAINRFIDDYPLTDEMDAIMSPLRTTYGSGLVSRLADLVSTVGCGEGQVPETAQDMSDLVSQLSITPVTALGYFADVLGLVGQSVWSVLAGVLTLQFKVVASIRDAIGKGIATVVETVTEALNPEFIVLGSSRKPNYLPYPVHVIRVSAADHPEITVPLNERFSKTNEVCVVGRGVVFIVKKDPASPDDTYFITVHALTGRGTYASDYNSSGYSDGIPNIFTGTDTVRLYPQFWRQYNSPFGIAGHPIPQTSYGNDAKTSFAGLIADYNVMLTLGLIVSQRLSAFTIGDFLTETEESIQANIQSSMWQDWYQYLGYCDPTTGVARTPWPVTGDSSWVRRMVTTSGVSDYEACSTVDVAKALAFAGYDAAEYGYSIYDRETLSLSSVDEGAYVAHAVLLLAGGATDFESLWRWVPGERKSAFLAFSNNWRVMRSETFLQNYAVATLATDAQQKKQLRTIGIIGVGAIATATIVLIGALKWVPQLTNIITPRLWAWRSRRIAIQTADNVSNVARLIKSD